MTNPNPHSPSNRTSVASKPTQLTSIEEAADEIERELQVRFRCYDRWVADGKLTDTEARRRYGQLYSALQYLRRFAHLDSVNTDVIKELPKERPPETA